MQIADNGSQDYFGANRAVTPASQIPAEAYLYFPNGGDDLFFTCEGQQYRRIFEGNLKLKPEEQAKLDAFMELIKQNNIVFKDPVWTPGYIFRFLQAKKFDLKLALESLVEHGQWRKKNLPPILTDRVKESLEKGVLYICGRDCKYRPIMVLRCDLILQLQVGHKLSIVKCR